MTLEQCHRSGAVEQTLTMGDMKMSVLIDEATHLAGMMPERCFHVSSRKRQAGGSLDKYETIFRSRTISPQRKNSVDTSALLDDLAANRDQASDSTERGDASAMRILVERTARACGAAPQELIDALRTATGAHAPEMAQCLREVAELRC